MKYTVKELISEMAPFYHEGELAMRAFSSLSVKMLKNSYKLIDITLRSNIEIYQNNNHLGFMAGKTIDVEFYRMLIITTRTEIYPVEPDQLTKIYQVSMVTANENFAKHGIAKETYETIAKKYDLVSDHEQYEAAKSLWQSLARDSIVNIYVFNGSDYIRDEFNHPVKYNGKNIDEQLIWGQTAHHTSVLLVATIKDLK